MFTGHFSGNNLLYILTNQYSIITILEIFPKLKKIYFNAKQSSSWSYRKELGAISGAAYEKLDTTNPSEDEPNL